MVTAGDSGRSFAQRLGIHQDQIVQELGWMRTLTMTCGPTSRRPAVANSWTRMPTRLSTSCCCGGATVTAIWWIG